MLVDTKWLPVPKTKNSHVPLQRKTNKKKFKRKNLQTETTELFSAYLAQSQEGDCHERKEKVTRFIFL